jgi:hypothetical protein
MEPVVAAIAVAVIDTGGDPHDVHACRRGRPLGRIWLVVDPTSGDLQMYISRTDRFVWIECAKARPWLISPEQPEAFVRALGP